MKAALVLGEVCQDIIVHEPRSVKVLGQYGQVMFSQLQVVRQPLYLWRSPGWEFPWNCGPP